LVKGVDGLKDYEEDDLNDIDEETLFDPSGNHIEFYFLN